MPLGLLWVESLYLSQERSSATILIQGVRQ